MDQSELLHKSLQEPSEENYKGPSTDHQPKKPVRNVIPRRTFLKCAAMVSSFSLARLGPFPTSLADNKAAQTTPDHFVPENKGLSEQYVSSLFEKGTPRWFSGSELDTIGMPVGGICAGQVYLLGDGRLGYWDIFNQQENSGYGQVNWKLGRGPEWKVRNGKLVHDHPVDQGFAIGIRLKEKRWCKWLNRKDFENLKFRGEYPIGRVDYTPGFDLPIEIQLEAFSPFIPLDPHRSSLPAVLLGWHIRNRTEHTIQVSLIGWLSNAVCLYSRARYGSSVNLYGQRIAEDTSEGHRLHGITFGAHWVQQGKTERPPVIFADFEQDNYDGWVVEGDAFGQGPARGTAPGQQPVTGFEGKGLVNTFLKTDQVKGRLISPRFQIQRRYISFLIGGGNHPGKTCINLIVNGQVVRTATGKNREHLEPYNWDVSDLEGQEAYIEIVDAESGPWGHINIDSIQFRDTPLGLSKDSLSSEPDFGTMGIYCFRRHQDPRNKDAEEILGWTLPLPFETAEHFCDRVIGSQTQSDAEPSNGGSIGISLALCPGQSETIWFGIVWHFPNLYREGRWVGNHYARHYSDASDVARFLLRNLNDLIHETRLWRDTYYDSTLPWWLLDRIHAPVANLATTTAQWWYNGRFWAWEGTGCCHGTCGHVWNYAQAAARLFPSLERSVREMQDFMEGVGLREDGSIAFRGEGWPMWAADAQAGYVLKAYREHLCSTDAEFLNRLWPKIRTALQFLIDQDKDNNGLLEGRQHQTFDQEFYGPNTYVGSLYLAALRAGEEMARLVGDFQFAEICRRLFKAGSDLTVKELWNGEYFVQKVDLGQYPEWQYADGCLSDQLLGQNWANQLGLGYIYPQKYVKTALMSIWKYNWAPDVTAHNQAHPPERWFLSPGDAGLFVCTWPKSRHLGPRSTRYRDEVWTGTEYQVASHLIWEGFLAEGLAICRAVHDRYMPPRFNPWNEVECGDHYARALASWGILLAISGFEYNGPAGLIGFSPRLNPEFFRSAYTAAEGWGTLEQRRFDHRQLNKITVRWGRLRLNTIRLTLPHNSSPNKICVTLDDQPVSAEFSSEECTLTIRLVRSTTITAGSTLTVTIDYSDGTNRSS